MMHTSLLLIKSLNKTETPIFLSVVFFFFCFQRQFFDVYFITKCNSYSIICFVFQSFCCCKKQFFVILQIIFFVTIYD